MSQPPPAPNFSRLAELQPLHEIGTLVDQSASLSHRNFSFSFRCWGALVQAEYHAGDDQDARLELRADLGSLPFTSQNGGKARANLLSVLKSANGRFGRVFQVHPNGTMLLQQHLVLPKPVTAAALLSALTCFMVPLKPYLTLLWVVTAPPSRKGLWG